MQYIASISGGKDSIILPDVCREFNLPLDGAIHTEIMATPTIPADLPPMMEFKEKAFKQLEERYGVEVKRVKSKYSYEEYFYMLRSEKAHAQNVGKIYGFPMVRGAWCNSRLKVRPMNNALKGAIAYIGIAADEPNRFHNLTDRKRSPLVEHGITEGEAYERAKRLGLLSPIYTQTCRSGCWFCHNQSIGQLRLLRHQYPEYWALMLKWDNDSPVTFKPDGTTVHLLDERFANEDAQMNFDEMEAL